MRWKTKPTMKRRQPTMWHRWFAWHPIKTEGGTWCWLEYVERRMHKQFGDEPFSGPVWLYHTL